MNTMNPFISPEQNKKSQSASSKVSRFVTKINKATKRTPHVVNNDHNDHFIINHLEQNTNVDTDIDCKVSVEQFQRRTVFVSLIGVFKTWKQCPSVALYSAIFLLPLKQEWIYYPKLYSAELKLNIVSQISLFSEFDKTKEFIELVKWKDSQGLVLWMMDFRKKKRRLSSPHPFWLHFSSKLANLYDPITLHNYKSLNLEEKYWINRQKLNGKYGIKTSLVLEEIQFLRMEYRTMQEIIYHSNPKSLNPIIYYGEDYVPLTNISPSATYELYNCLCDDAKDWWISPHYDADDI